MEQTASCCLEKGDYPLEAVRMQHLTAREAEAAIYHLQLFEEFRAHYQRRGHRGGLLQVQWGYYAHQIWQECSPSGPVRPRAPIIAVTCNPQTARQAHLYRGVFPGLSKDSVQDDSGEDVDLRVSLTMNVGKARGFFKKGDVVIVLTGWPPGSGFTNTMHVVPVPYPLEPLF